MLFYRCCESRSASALNKNSDRDPHPDSHQLKMRIGIRFKLDPDPHQFAEDSQNVWIMSLFEHFFKGLSFYLETKIWILIRIRIRIRVKSRIRIRIKVMRIHNTDFFTSKMQCKM